MRWSLRSLVALITVIAMVLAYRQNTIRGTQRATRQILDAGGQVIYRWQNADVVKQQTTVTHSYTTWKYNLETGERTPGPPPQYTVTKQGVVFQPPLDVKDSVIGFCFGHLAELDVNIVVLPATAVDENVASALAAITGLESVLIQGEHPGIGLATAKLESELPGVTVVSGAKLLRPIRSPRTPGT